MLNSSSLNELGILSLISCWRHWGGHFQTVVKKIFSFGWNWFCDIAQSHTLQILWKEGWWGLKVWGCWPRENWAATRPGVALNLQCPLVKTRRNGRFSKEGLGMALGWRGRWTSREGEAAYAWQACLLLLRCLFTVALLGGALGIMGCGLKPAESRVGAAKAAD